MNNTNKEIILTSAQIIALAQLLTWLRGGVEEILRCILESNPERLAGLCRLLLEHPCVVADLATMDAFIDRLCELDGRVSGEAHRTAVRANITEQADAVMVGLRALAKEAS